ncbi:MAG: gliding motility-associated C-terminal domain-containing protein, partial [Bacteroidota bacterium]
TGAIIHPQSGTVDLSGTVFGPGAGNHQIQYTTPGACPTTGADTIRILPASSATFGYGGNKFCSYDSLVEIDTTTTPFQPGGTFTIVPSMGLQIDTITGSIQVDSSVADTYNITYALQNAACDETFTQQIIIIEADDSTVMFYTDSIFCPNDDDPSPVLLGDSSGTFLNVQGLIYDDTLGTILLGTSTQNDSDFYSIRYQLPGECGRIIEDSILIQTFTPSAFAYQDSIFCTTDTNPRPIFISSPGGIFEVTNAIRQPVPFIDSITGAFYVDSVQNNGAQYFITYLPPGNCTSQSERIVQVNFGPDSLVLTPLSPLEVCRGVEVEFQATVRNGGQFTFFFNGDSIPAADLENEFTFGTDSLNDGDVISVTVANSDKCRDSTSTMVTVYENPVTTIQDTSITITDNQLVNIGIESDVDNTLFTWVVSSNVDVIFSSITDTEGPSDSGEVALITNAAVLQDSSSPAVLTYLIFPVSNGCPGIERTVRVNVNPENIPIFIPEVMTPNQDGLNDTWQIQWTGDVPNPDAYRMLLYNRTGSQVLDMQGLRSDWDGGTLPDGVYWWNLLGPGGSSILKGGLTIRRK